MRNARRLVSITLALVLAAGCGGGEERRPVEGDARRLISIEADRSTFALGEPILLRITVYSDEGERLPGQRVSIESSSPVDRFSPREGVTDSLGELVAEFSGGTLGARTITARSGAWWGAVSISLDAPACGGRLLLGGMPALDVVWPTPAFWAIQLRADFNGNGTCDLAWIERSLEGRPELKVRGEGLAWPPSDPFPPGSYVKAAVAGDFFGEGSGSLAVAAGAGSSSWIHLLSPDAAGAWSVIGTVEMPEGAIATSLAVIDVDGDGREDLFVEVLSGTSMDPEVRLHAFTWDAGSGLVEIGSIRLGDRSSEATWLAGDFDGDGKGDVIVRTMGSSFILKGNGDGSFTRANIPSLSEPPAAAADLNGDGRLDIVGLSWRRIEIALQTKDGGFDLSPLDVANEGEWIRIADLDNDGVPDLWVISANGGTALEVLPGRGDGTFGEAIFSARLPHLASNHLELCDYWGAGEPGLVLSGPWGMTVLPVERLGPVVSGPLDLRPSSAAVAVGDLDGDGVMEIAAVSDRGGTVRILRADGQAVEEVPIVEAIGYARVEIGPVGRDPIGSLLVAEPTLDWTDTNLRLVALSTGASELLLTVPGLRAMAVGDLGGDGRPDVVAATGDEIYALLSTDGGFRLEYAALRGADALALGDFDGDGIPDLALLDEGGFEVLRGTTTGEFVPFHRIELKGASLAAADLDGDGMDDAVIGGSDVLLVVRGGELEVRSFPLGEGWGDLEAIGDWDVRPFPPRNAPGAFVTTGDFDGDGALDVLAGRPGASVSVLLGDGTGGFSPAATYPVSTYPVAAAHGSLEPGTLGLLLLDHGGGAEALPITCSDR